MIPARVAFHDARLGAVLRTLVDADLDRPTGCPPWTVRELLAHVRAGVARLHGFRLLSVAG